MFIVLPFALCRSTMDISDLHRVWILPDIRFTTAAIWPQVLNKVGSSKSSVCQMVPVFCL